MTLEEIQLKIESPEWAKFTPYLQSFFGLTRDERKRVLKRHAKFNEYHKLFYLHMKLLTFSLNKDLEVGAHPTLDQVLKIEPIENTLRFCTFDVKKIGI